MHIHIWYSICECNMQVAALNFFLRILRYTLRIDFGADLTYTIMVFASICRGGTINIIYVLFFFFLKCVMRMEIYIKPSSTVQLNYKTNTIKQNLIFRSIAYSVTLTTYVSCFLAAFLPTRQSTLLCFVYMK